MAIWQDLVDGHGFGERYAIRFGFHMVDLALVIRPPPLTMAMGAPKVLLPLYTYSPLLVARGALKRPPTPS